MRGTNHQAAKQAGRGKQATRIKAALLFVATFSRQIVLYRLFIPFAFSVLFRLI